MSQVSGSMVAGGVFVGLVGVAVTLAGLALAVNFRQAAWRRLQHADQASPWRAFRRQEAWEPPPGGELARLPGMEDRARVRVVQRVGVAVAAFGLVVLVFGVVNVVRGL